MELKEEEEEAGDDDGDDDSDGDDDDDDGDGDDDDDDDDDDDEVRLKRPPAFILRLKRSDETQKPEWYSKYEAKILWAKVGGYPWWPCYVPHLKDVPSRKHSQETLKSINKGYLWVFALGPRTCWMQVRAIEKNVMQWAGDRHAELLQGTYGDLKKPKKLSKKLKEEFDGAIEDAKLTVADPGYLESIFPPLKHCTILAPKTKEEGKCEEAGTQGKEARKRTQQDPKERKVTKTTKSCESEGTKGRQAR